MPAEAWLTLAAIAAAVFVLVRDLLPPAPVLLGTVVVLLVVGVIDTEQALAGFANPAPITVAALFVVARAVEKTGAIQPLVSSVLREKDGPRSALARLLFPVAGSSAVLNNTPIVAMLVPQVSSWAERRGRSPASYLMPLSFAAILGGVVTVLGTSTNLLVSGLLEASGEDPIGVFEITRLGLPVAVIGTVALVLLAPRLLRNRAPARRDLAGNAREFVVDMDVVPDGAIDGLSVEAGGLRHLAGVFLVQVRRGPDLIGPVAPSLILRGGDRLRFVGRADNVIDLQAVRGLDSAAQEHVAFDAGASAFFEAVVGAESPLVGKTLKEAGFRSRYQAAVVAIHRAGARLEGKLGSIPIRIGDTLLLLADPGFRSRWYDRNDFLLVSPLDAAPPVSSRQAVAVAAVIVAIITTAATGLLSLLEASLLGAFGLVVGRVLSPGEARRAVDIDVVLLIAAALGLGQAASQSGLAAEIAGGLVGALDGLGVYGTLGGLMIATVILTELVSNAAAAAIMFPIAVVAAADVGHDPRGFAIAIAVAASASFLSPIGYQTNTMVYGPGGYRFFDYARLGAPLTAIVVVTTVILEPLFWG
ncbi:MAG: SLC13 family permease [Acidimicrobiia bacterium]|nr:SLC13 family permease [Acidimicrobiia bacterium]NNF09010.1 SLC13 family permease [Acidimicrobiia bacterium]NNL69019.1 SLC13 family permease [Acidimicrobiia bacterium]